MKELVAMRRKVLGIAIAVVLTVGLTSCATQAGQATVAHDAQSATAHGSATASSISTSVNDEAIVPPLIGLSTAEAMATLKSAGLTSTINGDTSNPQYGVIAQTPQYLATVTKGSSVLLTIGESREQKLAREEAAANAKAAATAKAKADAAAKAKAAAAKALAAADADLTTYKKIDDRGWALVTKDPESYVGKKYVLYGAVYQFDAATGTSAFLATTGATEQEYSFSYDTPTLVTATDPSRVANVVRGDTLRMYVKVEGTYAFDTQAGGSTVVPRVAVHSFEMLGHDG